MYSKLTCLNAKLWFVVAGDRSGQLALVRHVRCLALSTKCCGGHCLAHLHTSMEVLCAAGRTGSTLDATRANHNRNSVDARDAHPACATAVSSRFAERPGQLEKEFTRLHLCERKTAKVQTRAVKRAKRPENVAGN